MLISNRSKVCDAQLIVGDVWHHLEFWNRCPRIEKGKIADSVLAKGNRASGMQPKIEAVSRCIESVDVRA